MSKELEGFGGGGSSNRAPIEAPDSLRSTAIANILDLVSEGEIVGFADQVKPMTCVFFNETPLENADGSANFRTVIVESRVGTQTQDPIPGFAGVENELGVGVGLNAGTPWTRSVTNPNVTSVRVRLSVLALSRTNTVNGDVGGYEVAYNIQVATNGGPFVTVIDSSFNGKTREKYERAHRIELPVGTSWQIRVNRITPDSTTSTIVDTTRVESFTEIVDVKLRLPMSALVGVSIDAEQFNNIPSRAYRLRGRIIRVPSNYNATTRTYTGIWNGTFQLAYCNNPAWVLYDLCTNSRYGLGHILADNNLDKWGLYAIARYCDELVPNGFGGTEPRFTCNLYLQNREDAYKVVMDVCTVFRGIVYAMGSTIVAEGDMPTDPIYTFNQSNVIEGSFTYSGSAKKVRHTVAIVSWNDLSDFGRAKVEYVEDEDGIARYGVQPTEVIAVGCTSRGQARRLGKYILLTEIAETDVISFAVGLDGTIPAPGKVVLVADPLRAGRRTGGRVRAATLNSITVDAVPTVVAGDTISAVMPTGLMETRTVASVNSTTNTITTTANFSAIPTAQSVWLVESSTLKAQAFKVISVTEDSENLTYAITGLRHIASKFLAVEQNLKLEIPPITDSPQRVVFRPQNLTFQQRDVADENTTTIVCEMGWETVVGAVKYNVMYRSNNNSWVDAGNTSGNTFEIYGLTPGKFQFQVTAVNALGIRSAPSFSEEVTVFPNAASPDYVNFLTTEIGTALTSAANAQSTADGKIDSFYQPEPPATIDSSEGDFWIDTNDGNRLYRFTAGAWVLSQDTGISQAITAAAGAQATADGRIRTYVGGTVPNPTPAAGLGDLWYDTTNSVLNRWNGSSWLNRIADVTGTIGGRNYVLIAGGVGPVGVSSPLTDSGIVFQVTNAPREEGSFLGNGYMDFRLSPALKPNTPYSVSFVAWSTNGGTIHADFFPDTLPQRMFTLTAAPTRFVWEGVSSPSNDMGAAILRFFAMAASNGAVNIADMKVEQGDRATAWSPNPQEVSAQIGAAVAAAENAKAIADGKIDSFYQPEPPTLAESSEGDFWIDTNDGNRLYRFTAGAWVVSRDTGISQAITAAAGAQATADGRIRTYVGGTVPIPTPPAGLGDLWYDTTNGVLNRWNGSSWLNRIADVTGTIGGRNYVLIAGGVGPVGVSSPLTDSGIVFQVTNASGNGYMDFRLSPALKPNTPYSVSFVAWSTNGGTIRADFFPDTLPEHIFTLTAAPTRFVWEGVSSPSNDMGAAILRFFGMAASNGAVNIADMKVEQGDRATAWSPNPQEVSAQIGAAFAAAENAKAIADGKIDSFYQPNAPSVASEGDFWIDTDDNNRLYVRQGTAWVLARDGGIGQAITAAAGAQATADGRVRTYFDSTTPSPTPPAGLGDLWYQPTTQILRRWNGSAWVTISANDGTVVQTQIFNPSFEQGLTGWSDAIGAGLTGWTVEAGGYTGSNRLTKSGGTNGNTGVFNSSGLITVKPGERIAALVQCAAVSVSVGSLSIGFAYYNASGSLIGDGMLGGANDQGYNTAGMFLPGVIGSAWSKLRRVELVPPDAVGARVCICVHGYNGFGAWIFDSVEVENLQVTNQTSLIPSLTTSYGFVRDNTSLTANSSGQVSVNAHSVRYGSVIVPYSAVTNAVTGLTPGVRYVIYCFDPFYVGGIRQWFAGTDPATVMGLGDGVAVTGEITIPTSGEGSGGGGSGGGGVWCVDANSFMPDGRLACEVMPGTLVECWNYASVDPSSVMIECNANPIGWAHCYRLIAASGVSVIASESTPMSLRDGSVRLVPQMLGEEVLVRSVIGTYEWQEVTALEYAGYRRVAKISVKDRCYFAAEHPGATIATHNNVIKP